MRKITRTEDLNSLELSPEVEMLQVEVLRCRSREVGMNVQVGDNHGEGHAYLGWPKSIKGRPFCQYIDLLGRKDTIYCYAWVNFLARIPKGRQREIRYAFPGRRAVVQISC